MIPLLVVDDEASIRNVLSLTLAAHGFKVHEAATLTAALEMAIKVQPQIVLLDLGLPEGGGIDVLKSIRQWSNVPIIVLTVDDSETTKVALLKGGADDYVTKPFSMQELIARIGVALRHANSEKATPLFSSGDLRVDLAKHEVYVKNAQIHLTVTEYEILRILVRSGGQVTSQTQLLSEVWGPLGLENPHYIRIYIGHLRKKIETDPAVPKHIITEPGVGYRLL